MNKLRQEWENRRCFMHYKMRLDECKTVKGKLACKIDIYWAFRSVTVYM